MSKVFGIGVGKTATTSLKAALKQLGFRTTGPNGIDNNGLQALADRPEEHIEATMRENLLKYDAFQDFPWFLKYQQLDVDYPGSKFILTIRDPESWWLSALDYFGRSRRADLKLAYGVECVLGKKQQCLDAIARHNQEVLEYFADRPDDLLVMDICAGEGYEKLCPFLNVPLVNGPMPRSNVGGKTRGGPLARIRTAAGRRLYRLLFG